MTRRWMRRPYTYWALHLSSMCASEHGSIQTSRPSSTMCTWMTIMIFSHQPIIRSVICSRSSRQDRSSSSISSSYYSWPYIASQSSVATCRTAFSSAQRLLISKWHSAWLITSQLYLPAIASLLSEKRLSIKIVCSAPKWAKIILWISCWSLRPRKSYDSPAIQATGSSAMKS